MRGFLISTLAWCVATAHAGMVQEVNQTFRLKHLDSQITSAKKDLNQAGKKRLHIEQELKSLELNINQITQRLQKMNQDIATEQKTLLDLEAAQHRSWQDLQTQREYLSVYMKKAYALSRVTPIQIFLSQSSPKTVARAMHYYNYFNEARMSFIADIQRKLHEMSERETQIKHHTEQLQHLIDRQVTEQHRLEAVKIQRMNVLEALNQSIDSKAHHLDDLQASKHALEEIIQKLRTQKTRQSLSALRFSRMRGDLHWPVSPARRVARFGDRIEYGTLKSNGVLLATTEGQEVRVVYPGKVIFSGWLKGFGLLMIVDHGHGYMTLYGRNQTLYRQVGDWLQAGDLIAASGHSGGFSLNRLYFEIRKEGVPQNPERWCRRLR